MLKILGNSVWLLLLFGICLQGGSITAKVDTNEIVRGDSVFLTITITGQNIDEIPDIPELDGVKVEDIQRRTQYNYVSVDGVSRMEKTQILTLELRPRYNMIIAPFSVTVDGVLMQTESLQLRVTKKTKNSKKSRPNFSLEMKANKQSVYLGESLLVTVYFRQRTLLDVTQLEYEAPKFKGFFSKQVEEEKSYKEGIYTVNELRYILIPKEAGTFSLDEAEAKVAQRSQERQEGGWYIDVPKWTHLHSDTLTIKVLSTSKVHDIVGNYILKTTIDRDHIKANEPINLTVTLLGEGTLEDYDGINFKIPSVTTFSDSAEFKSEIKGDKLYSRYLKKFVFVANHSFEIPSKIIRVYDYKSDSIKILHTDSYQIEVESTPEQEALNSLKVKTSSMEAEIAKLKNGESKIKSLIEELSPCLALFLSFLLGVFVTLFFHWIELPQFFGRKQGLDGYEAWKILYPKISESREVEIVVRQLYAIKSGEKDVHLDKELLRKLVKKYKEVK